MTTLANIDLIKNSVNKDLEKINNFKKQADETWNFLENFNHHPEIKPIFYGSDYSTGLKNELDQTLDNITEELNNLKENIQEITEQKYYEFTMFSTPSGDGEDWSILLSSLLANTIDSLRYQNVKVYYSDAYNTHFFTQCNMDF